MLLFLSLFFSFTAPATYSCVCEIMKPGKKLQEAKAVFVGEAVEIGGNDKSDWATVAVKFKVDRYWKGVKEEFVTVVGAPASVGACGLPVEIGKKYLIYAFELDKDQLETSFCSSRRLDGAEDDLAIIGKGKNLKINFKERKKH